MARDTMVLAVRNSSHAFNIAGKHDTFSRNSKKYSGGLDYIIYGD
jgi:mRNA deadenylase 3'-5' endonuclease subunit Ccr4